jgi:Ca-activated chloride channel family protein
MILPKRASPLTLGLIIASVAAALADDAILVLDASGSMWGQIDGKSKVEIARTAVGDLLGRVPADRGLGLVAYGHRREGDCTDIEEIVPVGSDRAPIRSAVAALGFKGMTPLGAAVRFAAEKLRYKDTRATVILVSDGVETCGVDPCALGRDLEAAGVDFTAHIIGFGLASAAESAGLRCLAEATGGRYFGAQNAGELAAALAETVAKPVEPPPAAPQTARVILRATELDGGPEITSGLTWTVELPAGAAAFEQANAGVVETDVAPGAYEVKVVRADGLKGSARLDARAGAERTVTIPLDFPLEATLALTPATGAPAGSKVSVAWTGPKRPGDYVTVVKTGALPTDYLDYKVTDALSPVEITLPVEPGEYEIRYVLARPTRVLASVPVTTVATAASITVPATAPAGTEIEVAWTGPGYHGDWVTIVAPGDPVTRYNSYFDAKPENRKLTVPTEAGAYEVRYVQGGQKVLARAPITVTPVVATITAPDSVAAAAQFEIAWTGPNLRGDWLTIVKADRPPNEYGSYVDAPNGGPGKLTAPATPGSYELRYVLGGKAIIGRKPISVTAP